MGHAAGTLSANIMHWPYGSSSIPLQHWRGTYPKSKLCSTTVSNKNGKGVAG